MKKIITCITIAFSLLNANLAKGVISPKEGVTIKGSIAVMPFRPLYAGQCKVDAEGKKDIRDLLNDHSIQPSDLLQEVWAWDGENVTTRFSSNPNWEYKGKYFPRYLPYKLLKDLKEDDILKIKIDGVDYELKADQNNSSYQTMGNFEQTLSTFKYAFDGEPNYFLDDKDFLIQQGILKKNIFGTVPHILKVSTNMGFYTKIAAAAGLGLGVGMYYYYNHSSSLSLLSALFHKITGFATKSLS